MGSNLQIRYASHEQFMFFIGLTMKQEEDDIYRNDEEVNHNLHVEGRINGIM